ncbi:MAG: hypothetical protein UU10_C0043G0005 [Parcubacteria group bacterium GW2011_GWF1_40_6]|uniref:DoxX family protein n=1 Tax=Candidatus Nomurabacteria bacterium RIFOXYB1_FULL_39_16 TaxID=1801803 RepID=A0A1F6YQW6_9BACT|nr:MAG: hypothetical protein UU10_C0043G0005 [Parcubacteria group bacterium GW2011_GWF1_40_6]OGJ08764.1 MAG: hypothetical protein A2356_01305 [Candidatus Nomurabacteria bacterium RIFOXYB1_FULL_39_16]OGJ14309.1 MAG: hypothetical protein A2585_00125 [Candidatus Nomurabacteria bacterium RIFOXYD1_FULL_39_12]
MSKQKIVLATLRIVMGFIFLWAFLDKVFGLGFTTSPGKAWIKGGSPTSGFLSSAVKGPFVDFFHSLAGVAAVDWVFMAGLLFVGLTLIFNKFVKWGAVAGILMLLFMYLALLWPANNPIIDEHIVYILVLALLFLKNES